MNFLASMLLGLLRGYISSLATKEFAHWALMEVAGALVKSTKTEEDDKWLAKIQATIEKK